MLISCGVWGKASRIYRVDLDGKETQVRFGDVRWIDIDKSETYVEYFQQGKCK